MPRVTCLSSYSRHAQISAWLCSVTLGAYLGVNAYAGWRGFLFLHAALLLVDPVIFGRPIWTFDPRASSA